MMLHRRFRSTQNDLHEFQLPHSHDCSESRALTVQQQYYNILPSPSRREDLEIYPP